MQPSENREKDRHDFLLWAENIEKSFGSGESRIKVLKGVDISVRPGEMIGVVGVSGSGKTTLLQILGTLDTPDRGRLLFQGRNLRESTDMELCDHRNKMVGFIFQFHHLLPEFTALENVIMPGLIAGENKPVLHSEGLRLLDRVGLGHRSNHRSGELSGGEQQRVALARALIMKPTLLLADEPTGNLDSKSGRLVFDLLGQLSRDLSLTVIMVTHNMELAKKMDYCLTLRDGVLIK